MTNLFITKHRVIGDIKKSFKTNWNVIFYIDKDSFITVPKTTRNDKLKLEQLSNWKAKVIKIDDNTTVRKVKELFKDAGYEVLLCNNNDNALDNYKKLKDV